MLVISTNYYSSEFIFPIQVKSILSWGEDKRNHFRLKSRAVLEKLVRKMDYSTVANYVPKKHKKLMVHIRRMNSRHKRDKLLQKERRAEHDERLGQVTRNSYKPRCDDFSEGSTWLNLILVTE